jgi:hypothetical protein
VVDWLSHQTLVEADHFALAGREGRHAHAMREAPVGTRTLQLSRPLTDIVAVPLHVRIDRRASRRFRARWRASCGRWGDLLRGGIPADALVAVLPDATKQPAQRRNRA